MIFSAIILSGGPNSVYVEHAPVYDPELLSGRLPILGICYGFQVWNPKFYAFIRSQKYKLSYKNGFLQINK